jgi:hypothetical protein
MAVAVWTQVAAIAAHTAYGIPAAAGLPPGVEITGVASVTIAPLANAGAASTVSPVTETGTAPNNAAPAAGQVSLQTASQQLVSGDAIPANSVVVAVLRLAGDAPVNP